MTKYFNNPERADEVYVKGGVITAIGRDGRQIVDPEPTCEAEMTAIITRLLAQAGATVDLEHTIVVHQIWDNQVRASVSIPPTASRLDCTFRIYRKQRTTLPRSHRVGCVDQPGGELLGGVPLGDDADGRVRGAGLGQVDVHVGVDSRRHRRRRTCGSSRSTGSCSPTSTPAGIGWRDRPAMTLRDLSVAQLNFNPHLAVSSETLGAEAFELIRAANSGCGFITTVHSLVARPRR